MNQHGQGFIGGTLIAISRTFVQKLIAEIKAGTRMIMPIDPKKMKLNMIQTAFHMRIGELLFISITN